MASNKSVKCKICGKKYVSKQALIDHIEKAHSANIPEGWNAARYENYLRTGKTEGKCVYCGKETGWNDTTGKYNRMCGSEACKKKARDLANKNYIGKHGKPYTINDPEQQKKMVYGRKNSGKYVFEDEDTGKKYVAMYDSSYGRDFLEMLDTFLNWDGADIIAPSPHTYYYEYEGKKHFYIPDVYSTSLNLEIELKDGGDNPNMHPKIQAVDKIKEKKKDEVMESLKGQVNYIKICNKDYTEFFALLSSLKEKDTCQLPKWEGKLESINESTIETDIVAEATLNHYRLFAKRQKLLKDPMLNYDNLMEYYRKRLFHDNLSKTEWDALYNELNQVRDYLKAVINDTHNENNKRMNYEAKKALQQVEGFIIYMEDKNQIPVKESEQLNATHIEVVTESKIITNFKYKWYHLVPKGSDMSIGILSPRYMAVHNKEEILPDALDKYRDRLVDNDFNIYPGRDPESLSVDEILLGLKKIRGSYGDKCIYMFRYPPYFGMGKTMDNILSEKDLYEIDLNKVNDIEYIDYGRRLSRGNGEPLDRDYYDKVSPEEYFSQYDDSIGMVFSTLNHISVSTKSGYIPRKALRRIQIPRGMNNSGPYTTTLLESINSNKVPFYIVSWDYDSMVGGGVKLITKSQYNHTSIALTPNLEECYTFSRNPETVKSHRTNGFCKESLSYMVSRYGDANIKVDAVYVSKSEYNKLRRNIEEYIKKQENTSFDYMNFVYSAFKIPREELDEDKLNCSVFVDLLLKKSGIDLTNGKNSNLVTPGDLSELDFEHKNITTVYIGKASEYNLTNVSESTFIEATKGEERYYPIFIFLSYTGTNMAKMIKSFTHDPYSHSSLSFDTELTNMVSFNREGMVIENIKDGLWKEKAASIKYSLYMYLATAEEYDAMRNFVNELLSKRANLKYNILGLTNFVFGRGSDREDKFFCSEFVAATINAGDKKVIKTKPYMTSPYMLAKNKNFKFIKKGLVKNYNAKVVDNIIQDYLEGGGYENVTIK